jgi:hypothetical protein
MLRRVGILLLALFQAFWLNVLLPGHTRGQIVMPGAPSSSAAVGDASPLHACCQADEPAPADQKSGDVPSKGRAANCALCAFAAHMTVPPPVDLAPRPTNFLCLLPDPRTQSVTTLELVLSYLGRAPPAA